MRSIEYYTRWLAAACRAFFFCFFGEDIPPTFTFVLFASLLVCRYMCCFSYFPPFFNSFDNMFPPFYFFCFLVFSFFLSCFLLPPPFPPPRSCLLPFFFLTSSWAHPTLVSGAIYPTYHTCEAERWTSLASHTGR